VERWWHHWWQSFLAGQSWVEWLCVASKMEGRSILVWFPSPASWLAAGGLVLHDDRLAPHLDLDYANDYCPAVNPPVHVCSLHSTEQLQSPLHASVCSG